MRPHAVTAAVVTVSDSCSEGSRVDLSGPAVGELLAASGFVVIEMAVVPDEHARIVEILRRCSESALLVVTTGGTGLAPRDVTPEATREVCDRVLDGLAEVMRAKGRRETPFAALGRGICGSRGGSLILNLPGSPRGAVTSLKAVLELVPHAIELLSGGRVSHEVLDGIGAVARDGSGVPDSMVLVRAATAQDASAIAHVHVQSWLTTYKGIIPDEYLASLDEQERARLWQDWLTRDIRVYVVELHNEVVGFVSGGPIREPADGYDAELFAIYLLERAQGRGLGKVLLKKLAQSLRTDGFKSMLVWVLERNPAVRFYENAGASRVSAKEIEIGGAHLQEISLAWPDLERIAFSVQ